MDDRAQPSRPARRWPRLPLLVAALGLLVLSAWTGVLRAASVTASPCRDAVHRQLDFWLGEWRAVDDQGRELGTSRVEVLHGGCVIQETWTSAGDAGSGESLSFVDPADGVWHQVWIGSSGNVVRYQGTVEDGVLRFEGEDTSADGTIHLSRAMLRPEADGHLHHKIERSDDAGATWSTYFEATYVPAAEAALLPEPAPQPPQAEPPAPAPPAPAAAPEPSEAERPGKVTAVSVEVPDAELPPEERSKIRLKSPMELEVPVGAIESIPEEYSWSTDETAQYVADGASITRVTVSRDENKKGVALDVTVALHSGSFLQHGDLDVALLAPGGEPAATAHLENFSLGRSLSGQKGEAGLEKKLRLQLDRATFDRLFGKGPRPLLRLTLTVRE